MMTINIMSVPTKFSVAFLGVGRMGYPIATRLAHAGHSVTVYNRTEHKALQWVQACGADLHVKRAAMPIDAAWKAKVVFACVADDEALRSVTLGKNGAFAGMKPGTIFVDHSSTSADVARELAHEAEKRAIGYLDAPILGDQSDAENARLTILAGGSLSNYERVKPIISAYAQAFTWSGPVGSAQRNSKDNLI